MCARQGRSGKAGGYGTYAIMVVVFSQDLPGSSLFPGDVSRQLVLSIDDVKGPGAMLQLPAHANQTGLVQRRRTSRGRRGGKGGD